jgi:hypothetical protein
MAEAFSSMGAARFDHQYHSVAHSMVSRMVHRMIHQQLPLLDCSMLGLPALVLAKVNMAIFMWIEPLMVGQVLVVHQLRHRHTV